MTDVDVNEYLWTNVMNKQLEYPEKLTFNY